MGSSAVAATNKFVPRVSTHWWWEEFTEPLTQPVIWLRRVFSPTWISCRWSMPSHKQDQDRAHQGINKLFLGMIFQTLAKFVEGLFVNDATEVETSVRRFPWKWGGQFSVDKHCSYLALWRVHWCWWRLEYRKSGCRHGKHWIVAYLDGKGDEINL